MLGEANMKFDPLSATEQERAAVRSHSGVSDTELETAFDCAAPLASEGDAIRC